MAESESLDCPCSNIAIMQLFHELKQSYPTVPDQIVSKVIQENYHDKGACETILQKESHAFLQSYPGAIISGNPREGPERGSLCSQCPASRSSQQSSDVTHPPQCAMPNSRIQPPREQENAFSASEDSSICLRKSESRELLSGKPKGNSKGEGRPRPNPSVGPVPQDGPKSYHKAEDISKESASESSSDAEAKSSGDGSESISNSSRTCCSECDSDRKSECSEKSHECGRLPSLKSAAYSEVETVRWNVEDGGRVSGGASGVVGPPVSPEGISIHNYQVAVQYSMQPALPLRQGGQQRSFTTVNLSLRPPSSEPQPPIEIQSGQNLTYTTSVFDAKKGVQSQLQIRIGPALLEKQRERKDLLARELRKEKEKVRSMQNEIRAMKISIAQKPSVHLLPKLKSEIERLRTQCKRLADAVDLYSDAQNNLPLGETNEAFYRNIYTGQRLQREGSWSCQLCTFRNHPLLSVCEECEMPRISLGTQVMDITSRLSVLPNNNTSFCTGGGTSTSASLITAPLQVESQSKPKLADAVLLTGTDKTESGSKCLSKLEPFAQQLLCVTNKDFQEIEISQLEKKIKRNMEFRLIVHIYFYVLNILHRVGIFLLPETIPMELRIVNAKIFLSSL